MLDISYFSFNNLRYEHTFEDINITIKPNPYYLGFDIFIDHSNFETIPSMSARYTANMIIPQPRVFPDIEINGKINPILLNRYFSKDVHIIRDIYTLKVLYEIVLLLFRDDISEVGYKIYIDKKD